MRAWARAHACTCACCIVSLIIFALQVDRQRKELERKLDDYHLISTEGWVHYNADVDDESSSDEHDLSSST